MEKDHYHHGDLKEELIEKGLFLINTEGEANFSLRKVAILCNVSHAAPYKHFKNKEELMEAIQDKIMNSFRNYLQQIIEENQGPKCLLEVGKGYVRYMMEHREYFRGMFFGDLRKNLKFEADGFRGEQESPFSVFYNEAKRGIEPFIVNKRERDMVILKMWCNVHGLATLLAKEIVKYDGDYEELVEEMLLAQNYPQKTREINNIRGPESPC